MTWHRHLFVVFAKVSPAKDWSRTAEKPALRPTWFDCGWRQHLVGVTCREPSSAPSSGLRGLPCSQLLSHHSESAAENILHIHPFPP